MSWSYLKKPRPGVAFHNPETVDLQELTDRPIHKELLVKVDQVYLSVVADEVLQDFLRRYEQVYEEERMPVRHFVRRPWGFLFRPLYGARHFVLSLHWRVAYPLIRRHYHCMGYRLGLAAYKKAIRCELRGRPCFYDRTARRRYGQPIWKADS